VGLRPSLAIAFAVDWRENGWMIGGLLLIALAVLGYMGVSGIVVVPFVLLGAAAWQFRPRRGQDQGQAAAVPGWSWSAFARGLPIVTLICAGAYGLGWVLRVLG
jgi:hypothetical protein